MNGNRPFLPLLPSSLLTVFNELRLLKYFQVSSQTVFVFDYLITFPDEVEFVWNGKANPAAVLFFITRYLPFIDGIFLLAEQFLPNPSRSTCLALFHLEGWFYLSGFFMASSILILRTYAIWKSNKYIAYGLTALLIACTAGGGYFLEKSLLSLTFIPSPSKSVFPGCFIINFERILWISYLLILVFHSVILVLTLLRVIQQRRMKHSSLFRTIYRDGSLCYIYLFGVSFVNIVVLNNAPISLEISLVSFHRVMNAILIGRLVINIRRAATQSPRDLELSPTPGASGYNRVELSSLTMKYRN